jgi:hypothetical protein
VQDRDGWLSATPIRHYEGWTQQAHPKKRISRHGPAALREVAYLERGTIRDEEAMKRTGSCPTCGEPPVGSLANQPYLLRVAFGAPRDRPGLSP